MTARRPRVAVLLLTYGEPPRARFRDQYDYSLLILKRLTLKVAPIPRFLLPWIAFKRARGRVSGWREAAYSSPLEAITTRQVEALRQALAGRDPSRDYDVRAVYEFRRPLLPEVLASLAPDRFDATLLMPMYLADSDFTTGISRGDLLDYQKRFGAPPSPSPRYVCSFSDDNRMDELMERFVLSQLENHAWNEQRCRESALLLGVHGTLVNAPAGIDTGLGTTRCFYQRLHDRLASRFAYTSVGWLNHTLGGEWTSPDLTTAVAETERRGICSVVYYPFGFLADNAESQLEGRLVFQQHPALSVLHLPCMNDWPPFIDYLAGRVEESLAS
ncbi:ferrochelatase [bacterium]|nr:ferrochelatase [bacterium]